MVPMRHADVIVVGLGAMGSATAYQLAQKGASVIGIDRFHPPHSFGSSQGESRVTRLATAEGAEYVPLVMRSHALWREIEARTHTNILTECGVLMIGPASGAEQMHGVPDWIGETVALAERFDIAHETLTGAQASERFAAFAVDVRSRAYFEPSGGFVRPEVAITAQLQLASRHGAELNYGQRVTTIRNSGSGVVVVTDTDSYSADNVVISAGAGVRQFLRGPYRTLFAAYRQALHWFAVDDRFENAVSPADCPVYMWSFAPGPVDFFYGFPAVNGVSEGLKVATEQFTQSTSAEDLRGAAKPTGADALYARYLSGRLRAASSTVLKSTACLYTATSDSGFVIDVHPELEGVLVVSPCSGHGFKHSAAIGEAVAQLLLHGRSEIDLSTFGFARFLS